MELVPTDKGEQEGVGKMILLLVAPSKWHTGVYKLDGLNLFVELTSYTGHGADRYPFSLFFTYNLSFKRKKKFHPFDNDAYSIIPECPSTTGK